ncbi:MAG: hypothetical protein JO345_27585 [Streptosporangiaceae bacterium]|nr:hypothetical protein [Streptosporangiaceae bacterium]
MSETRTAAAPTPTAAKLARVRSQSMGLVFMLIIQFILGIIYNLYGSMPADGKSIGLFSNGWLIVHEIMGVLLLLAAIGLVAASMGTSSGLAKATSWIGLIGIIAAIGAGIGFTRSVGNGNSLGMSLAFAIALACYVINLARLPSGES